MAYRTQAPDLVREADEAELLDESVREMRRKKRMTILVSFVISAFFASVVTVFAMTRSDDKECEKVPVVYMSQVHVWLDCSDH